MRSAKKIALPLAILASGLAASMPAWTESDSSRKGRQEDNKDIVVEQLGGAVDVTVARAAFDVEVGSVLGLPARIVTGGDGNIAVRQSRTGVAIAPGSDVEIPEAARDGQLIARMIQHRGTAFYDVEPRPIEKLRVETPYLVAVVKGTQFSVLVEDGRTTVSLFEGLLELRSADDAEIVELTAGQIAIGVLDGGIRILPMNADLLPETAALGREGTVGGVGPRSTGAVAAVSATSDVDPVSAAAGVSTGGGASLGSVTSFSLDGGAQANVNLRDSLSIGSSSPTGAGVDVGLDASADVDGGSVDVGLDAGLNASASVAGGDVAVGVGLDAGVDLGGGSVEVGLDVGLDAGADVGGGGATVGLDAGLDAGADLGGGSVDVGLDTSLDAGADLGGGSVDVGLDTGLDVGTDLGGGSVDVGLDTSLDAGADLGGGSVDVGLDTSLDAGTDLGGGGVDVGLDVGLDSGVAVEADLGLGDVAIEAGLDLGLGEADVGGALDDLLGPGEDTESTDTEEDESLLPDLPLPLF